MQFDFSNTFGGQSLSDQARNLKNSNGEQFYRKRKIGSARKIAQQSSLQTAGEYAGITGDNSIALKANRDRFSGHGDSLTQTRQKIEGTPEQAMAAWDTVNKKYGAPTNGYMLGAADDHEREDFRRELYKHLDENGKVEPGFASWLHSQFRNGITPTGSDVREARTNPDIGAQDVAELVKSPASVADALARSAAMSVTEPGSSGEKIADAFGKAVGGFNPAWPISVASGIAEGGAENGVQGAVDQAIGAIPYVGQAKVLFDPKSTPEDKLGAAIGALMMAAPHAVRMLGKSFSNDAVSHVVDEAGKSMDANTLQTVRETLSQSNPQEILQAIQLYEPNTKPFNREAFTKNLQSQEAPLDTSQGAIRKPVEQPSATQETPDTPTARQLRGNPNPPTLKKLYESTQPVVGDTFTTPGGNEWKVTSIEPADTLGGRKKPGTKITLSHEKGRSIEITTERIWEQPSTPTPETGVKEPWQMTRSEWREAKTQLRPNDQGTGGDTRGGMGKSTSVEGLQSRLESITSEKKHLDYGLKPTYTVYAEDGTPRIVTERPPATKGSFFDDWQENPVDHSDVVKKALAEGKPVPSEVLADYPDLQPSTPTPETGVKEPVTPQISKTTPQATTRTPQAKEAWQMTVADREAKYPLAGEVVDGRTVGKKIKNTGSIESSIDDSSELPGIREVPMSLFEDQGKPTFYSSAEEARTKALADEIKQSGHIDPLIVVDDGQHSPYILEGGHRFDALKMNGAKSFPAKVVFDEGEIYNAIEKAVKEGKPVPPEVLADYPDLQPSTPTPETGVKEPVPAHLQSIIDNGGKITKKGNVVTVEFKPQLKGSDIVDPYPDEHLNPNSFAGAAELSVRDTYRKANGPAHTAAISNAVNQGMAMSEIDNLRFDPNSGVLGVTKKGGEPFQIKFRSEEDANRFLADYPDLQKGNQNETELQTPQRTARKIGSARAQEPFGNSREASNGDQEPNTQARVKVQSPEQTVGSKEGSQEPRRTSSMDQPQENGEPSGDQQKTIGSKVESVNLGREDSGLDMKDPLGRKGLIDLAKESGRKLYETPEGRAKAEQNVIDWASGKEVPLTEENQALSLAHMNELKRQYDRARSEAIVDPSNGYKQVAKQKAMQALDDATVYHRYGIRASSAYQFMLGKMGEPTDFANPAEMKAEAASKRKLTADEEAEFESRANKIADLQSKLDDANKKIQDLIKKGTNRTSPRSSTKFKSADDFRASIAERRANGTLYQTTGDKQGGAIGSKGGVGYRKTSAPNLTPDDIAFIWDYAKKNFIDVDYRRTFDQMISDTAKELDLTPEEVTHAFAADKSIKALTEDYYRNSSKRRQAVNEAKARIQGLNTPKGVKVLQKIWNIPRSLQTMGHAVGMVSHAGANAYRPWSWPQYWKAFGNQYKFLASRQAHEAAVLNIENNPRYGEAVRAGFPANSILASDEGAYINQSKTRMFGKLSNLGNEVAEGGTRAMDVLRTYVFDVWDKQISEAPIDIKNDPQFQKEAMQWALSSAGSPKPLMKGMVAGSMYSPRLETSRWQRMIIDPAKTLLNAAKWKTLTPAEKHMTVFRAKQAGATAGVYIGTLAANAALLKATNAKDDKGRPIEVNFTDPSKSDFLKHKSLDGHTIDTIGNAQSPIVFMSQLIKDSLGSKDAQYGPQKNKTPFERVTGTVGFYVRGKLNPAIGQSVDIATKSDMVGRPLWNASQEAKDKYKKSHPESEAYGPLEYFGTHDIPIAGSEIVRDFYSNIRKHTDRSTAENLMRSLALLPVTGAGYKISETGKKYDETGGKPFLESFGPDTPTVKALPKRKTGSARHATSRSKH